jgi:hypothetical protein
VWAGGGRMGLVSNPKIESEIVYDGVWTVERTFTEFNRTLKPRVLGSA